MQVTINIIIEEKDLVDTTVEQVIARVFPTDGPTIRLDLPLDDSAEGAEVVSYSKDSKVPNRDAGEIPQTQAEHDEMQDRDAAADQEIAKEIAEDAVLNDPLLDLDGVPHSLAIHSSNKKKYGAGSGGAKAGRWMKKRGVSDEVYASEGLLLAAAYKSAAAPAAAESDVGSTGEAGTTAEPAADVILPPGANGTAEVVQPVAENSAAVVDTAGGVEWKFPVFMQQMTAHSKSADDVLKQTAAEGVTTIAELAINPKAMATAAAALGFTQ